LAGTVTLTDSLVSTTTNAANNDDYQGAFGGSPNHAHFNSNSWPVASATLSTLEGVFAVLESGGTTEYAVTIDAAYDGFPAGTDPPFTDGYQLQIGFGRGANFVPASNIVPDLDFDLPLPADPAVKDPALTVGPGIVLLKLELASHTADTLRWTSSSGFQGTFFLKDFFQFAVDVPDLPASVMDFYSEGDLPANFPVGARAFTVRGRFVPEPSSGILAVMALTSLAGISRSKKPDG
jgi:hypothetical protein